MRYFIGSGTEIRTPIDSTKNYSPTIRRFPNILLFKTKLINLSSNVSVVNN